MRMMCVKLLAAAASLAVGISANAAPCDAPAFREFDFWIGDWQVKKPDGTIAGVNRIEREYDGCVLRERYKTERGYAGESLNVYDASRKLWHQTWVDNAGTVLTLEGRFSGGKMTLEGQTINADGSVAKQRITWTPNSDGTVRQLWESSGANGQWTTAFDGLYTRR